MLFEEIQTNKLCKIRLNASDKDTTGVDAEKALSNVFGNKYRIRLGHPILDDHGIFYPQALFNNLAFDLLLALSRIKARLHADKHSDGIWDSSQQDIGRRVHQRVQQRQDDHIMLEEVVTFTKNTNSSLNIKANPPRQLLKAILLLFIKPSPAGTRKAEKYINPDITKVSVTVNGPPNKIYNNGIEAEDMWRELSCSFRQQKLGSTMDLKKFYTDNKFGVLSDLHFMADTAMHGSAVRLVNTNDGVFLEVERKTSGSGSVKCHVFTISDAQMNTRNKQLQSVQY